MSDYDYDDDHTDPDPTEEQKAAREAYEQKIMDQRNASRAQLLLREPVVNVTPIHEFLQHAEVPMVGIDDVWFLPKWIADLIVGSLQHAQVRRRNDLKFSLRGDAVNTITSSANSSSDLSVEKQWSPPLARFDIVKGDLLDPKHSPPYWVVFVMPAADGSGDGNQNAGRILPLRWPVPFDKERLRVVYEHPENEVRVLVERFIRCLNHPEIEGLRAAINLADGDVGTLARLLADIAAK